MAQQSGIFPIFLRAEYREDANGIPKFISRVQQAAKISEAELARVGNALNKALSAPRTNAGALDLGTAQLREQIKAQEQAALAARELQIATTTVAKANLDLSAALRPSIRAYGELAKAKEDAVKSDRAQLAAMQAVEAELAKGTRAVQARLAAEQSLANFRKTVNLNEGALRAASGQASIDRAALSGATLQGVLGRVSRASNPLVEQQRAAQAVETERLARAQAELAASAARLTAQIDPLAAAQQRYDATLAEANRLLQAGAISNQQFAQAQAFASTQLREASRAIIGVAEAEARRAQQQREAQAAQQALAASAAQLRAQLDPMFAAQQRFDQELARADDLLRAGAITSREYAAAQQLARDNLRQAAQAAAGATQAVEAMTEANRRGTTANQNVINSQRASRTAFIQLGQQLQDVAVQAQMGTNAFLIFGQQAPQAAFALSGLADSTNKTQRAIGAFATFLSGPWGAAIFVAVAALGPFVAKLFESGEAADLAKTGADNLAAAQSVLGGVFDQTSGKIKTQNELLLLNARLTALNLKSEALAKRTSANATFRNARSTSLADSFFGGGISDSAAARAGVAPRASRGQNNAQKVRELLEGVNSGRISADDALKRSANLDFTGTGATREEFQQAIIDRAFSADAERVAKLINDSLDSGNLSPQLRRTGGSGGSGGRSRTRSGGSGGGGGSSQADQLSRLAETIQRINERFDEQPRLIDAASEATRQLDAIMADLEERKPLGFEKLVEQAQAAKATVQEAVLRPFEQIREESERRLQIEELLATGQADRAVALQEIFRLEQQIGKLNDEQRTDIEDIVVREQQRLRILRDQQAVFNAQLDVLNSVRRGLTDILSGRSTDFFGNFTQSLQDLAGARLFESLFGQAFRDIENELQKGTPQGRANAAYAAQVDKTTQTTSRLEQALSVLADAATGAANRISSGGGLAAANDNFRDPKMALVQSILDRAGVGGITVTANRPQQTEIARSSVIDIARRIAEGVVSPFRDTLETVLGRSLGGTIGDSIAGVIAGKATGGTVGAVLGGLEGLTKGIKGLEGVSKTLGKLGGGAATGTMVAGIGQALGIKTSQTGGAAGGALGTLIGGPVGAVIGGIFGSIIGGLFKKTPRASATIGGLGGGLGVTGITGNKAELRTQIGGLGGSVLDAINSIAQQLGASLDSSRGSVSIGVRDGKFRVDPTGRGQTETKRGAIDFGEDAQAAVRAAVMDLIQDGVIKGLKASEDRLLKAAKDVESGLRDVLTFRGVFDQLRAIKDPVGAAVETLNREFTSLIDLFNRAGASAEEFASLEELYNLKRADAIKEATDKVVGSLRQLLDDLKIGDNGLSLRDRRNNALTQYNSLAARVAAGDKTAFDDFANVAKQLLDIERQLFGSTQSYFDRLDQVTKLTEKAIADQTTLADAGAATPSPFDNNASIARAIESSSAEQVSYLKAINDNLIALNPGLRAFASGDVSGSGSPLPVNFLNY